MRLLALVCLAGVLASTGCKRSEAVTASGTLDVDAPATPEGPVDSVDAANAAVKFLPVPLVAQAVNYTCGVAALRSVLEAYGESYSEAQLKQILKTSSQNGTSYKNMTTFMQDKGYTVDNLTGRSLGDVEQAIDAGYPVIVLLQAWKEDASKDYKTDWDDGHFAVATGYSASRLYFMDPSTEDQYTYIERGEFLDRWHDVDLDSSGVLEKMEQFVMRISWQGTPPELGAHSVDLRTVPKMD